MKFQFDLLPNEYKCLPRDTFGIVLGTFAMVLCIWATISLYLKNTWELRKYNDQLLHIQAEIDKVYETMKTFQVPSDEINRLTSIINFINKNIERPATSYVDFLFAFEQTVPDNVFIQDINPKDFSGTVTDFTLDGEAASVFKVLDFIDNLQKSGNFEDVFLRQNSVISSPEGTTVKFKLTFKYKVKK